MIKYNERLELAMREMPAQSLADALGLSYQAVRQVLVGTTSSFTAANNAHAARVLNVSSHWLATGEGKMDADALVVTPNQAIARLVEALEELDPPTRARAAALLPSLANDPQGPWAAWLAELLSVGLVASRAGGAASPQSTELQRAVHPTKANSPRA
jgi:hypothetical protein